MTDLYKKGVTAEADTVETLNFEPIKGYPMLNWQGKRPFTSTHFYPAQLKEQHGSEVNGWLNKIYWGDNLQVMSHLLKHYRGKVDLVYIDPPFDSKAEYKKKIKLQSKTVTNDPSAFEEKQYGDIWSNDEYLQFMFERIVIIRELLSETGSMYLHCDWHQSHFIRCICEEVFGRDHFLNEVIWCYSDAANSKTHWNTKHDVIFYVKKSAKWTFNYTSVLRDQTESNIKKYKFEDDKGRYRLFGKNISGSPIQWHRDVNPQWEITNPELVFRHYLKEGSLPLDWWTINPVNQAAHEKSDYPTQKPEKLLERIIKASSNPGDLVFDAFMGSGTTQAVSMKLGRRFLGADINLGAIQTTTKRLIEDVGYINNLGATKKASKIPVLPLGVEDQISQSESEISDEVEISEEIDTFYTGFEVYNVNNYDIFRNPIEAKDLLIEALELQKLQAGHLFDGERDGRMWKIMPVNKIATRQDLNEIIAGLNLRALADRMGQTPNQPAEKITLVCMGHEPDLAATLNQEVALSLNVKAGTKTPLDVQVLDILRDRDDLQFKRDSEAKVGIVKGQLVIKAFYPMNLLSKLSLQKEKIGDWREMVDSIMVDFNYDGAVFNPALVDIPEKNALVAGTYPVPPDAGTIRVKITDILSELLEFEVQG